MDENLINRLLSRINNRSNLIDEYISFSDKSYKPIRLDKNNFHKINKTEKNKKIAFIDGGNAELLNLANLSLQLVRVYYNIFNKNKKIDSKRFDFYVLVEAVDKNGEINYSVDIAPDTFLDKLLFDSFDETIREGNHRINISKVGEVVRRFLELHFASVITDNLGNGDIIVLDGSLKASITNENKFFSALFEKALKKGIIITALSKTCTYLTNNGNSAISAINSISPSGCWYYHPVAEISSEEHQADMFFVKLNEKSKYTFRFEVFKKNKYEIDSILDLLVNNSKDPVFLGYPYGLIDADKFARVSNNEKGYLKTMLMVKLKREDLEKQSDAHKILDSIG